MADFFSDLFDSFTGQQVTPQQTIIPTSDLLSQAYGTATAQAPNVLAYNQALAPGLTNLQLGVTNQLDPSILANLRGANASILDQLNMGEQISPELRGDITRRLLESGTTTGFGVSPAGVGNVLLDTALQQEARGRQRRSDALSAGAQGFQQSRSLYSPNLGFTPQDITGDIREVQAARDEYANMAEDIRRQNFSNLINTGGRIVGGIVGGVVTSGSPMGIEAGKSIGGSIFSGSRVAGRQQPTQSGGGGAFGSILQGLGGMGGGGGATGYNPPRYTGGEFAGGTGLAAGGAV